MIIGANPTDGHPVFASQMKRRLRQGAKLIVIDPRATGIVQLAAHPGGLSPPAAPEHERRRDQRAGARHRDRRPDEGQTTSPSAASRSRTRSGRRSSPKQRNSPEAVEAHHAACRRELVRGAARLYATGGNGAIYYGLGVTEHSQGTTMVMGIANLAMATGNLGREGVGVNPLRGQNNVQGSCDMGSFPHEFTGYRHVSDVAHAQAVRERSGA